MFIENIGYNRAFGWLKNKVRIKTQKSVLENIVCYKQSMYIKLNEAYSKYLDLQQDAWSMLNEPGHKLSQMPLP